MSCQTLGLNQQTVRGVFSSITNLQTEIISTNSDVAALSQDVSDLQTSVESLFAYTAIPTTSVTPTGALTEINFIPSTLKTGIVSLSVTFTGILSTTTDEPYTLNVQMVDGGGDLSQQVYTLYGYNPTLVGVYDQTITGTFILPDSGCKFAIYATSTTSEAFELVTLSYSATIMQFTSV